LKLLKSIITLIVVLPFAFPPASGYGKEIPITYVANGMPVEFTAHTGMPFIVENRTMMPLRACLDVIGCDVDWDQRAQTVITRKGNVSVNIPIGKKEIIVNGTTVSTDAEAIVLSGRTYLPLRAVMEAYGYTVSWDNASGTVSATG
jgi:hypothetical protein